MYLVLILWTWISPSNRCLLNICSAPCFRFIPVIFCFSAPYRLASRTAGLPLNPAQAVILLLEYGIEMSLSILIYR
jgi:hypothetical protein